jgi:hypothetical protein
LAIKNLNQGTGMDDHNQTSSLPEYLLRLLRSVTGKEPVHWTIPDCGLSSAHRYSVQFEDHSRVFVKAATDKWTEQWLRNEHFILSSVGAAFMPSVIKWIDIPPAHPVLITQDLSHAYWPASHKGVTWRNEDFDLLFRGIEAISSCEAPAGLPALQNKKRSTWAAIAREPQPFLKLNLCSEKWFLKTVPAMIEAEMSADVSGNALVHGDIRSDNVCIVDSRAIFVDWSHAARGNARQNIALILPSLHLEGGPAPFQIMPDGGGEAALGCAKLVERLSSDATMPDWLKNVFRRLIAIQLQWASQCLGVKEPDGLAWRDIG